MDDSLVVGSLQGRRDLLRDRERFVEFDPAALQALGQVFSLDELQNQEHLAVRFVEAVDRGDVRVIEGGQHLRFPLEAREPLGVLRDWDREDLDGDLAIELGVPRAEHLAHAACAEGGDDLVGAEPGSW